MHPPSTSMKPRVLHTRITWACHQFVISQTARRYGRVLPAVALKYETQRVPA